MLVLARFRVTMYKISLCCTRVSQNLDFCFCWNRSKFPLAPFLFFFPAFLSSFLFTLYILPSGRKSLDEIVGKPWKGDVDQFEVCWPVYAPILHQKRSVSESSRYTKCTVLWKDLSSLCQLLIWKVDWRTNWWRHKWFNDHYSKCRL